jgi:hypothetical protein
MSSDNYILIRKEGGFIQGDNAPTSGIHAAAIATTAYVGYKESASVEVSTYSDPVFKVFDLEDAIVHAQSLDTEYGYKFEGLGGDAS